MAKKNKEIERFDFDGLSYYDERIKKWFQSKLDTLNLKIKAIEQTLKECECAGGGGVTSGDIDGGNANSTYAATSDIDGGNAFGN